MNTSKTTQTTLPTAGQNYTHQGIRYVVEDVVTADDLDAKGMHNVARLMRKNNVLADVVVRRPRGRVIFIARTFRSGSVNFFRGC